MQEPLFEPNYLNLEYFFNQSSNLIEWLYNFFLTFLNWSMATDFTVLKIFFWVVSLFIILFVIHTIWKQSKLRKEEEKKYSEVQIEYLGRQSLTERNMKWQRILDHLDSLNKSNWSLAIMEADSMLDEVLDSAGYIGETLGERLKGAVKGDFTTLNEAWEAHKVRNKLAHEGANFNLSKREAERVINLYRKVFEEFHYI